MEDEVVTEAPSAPQGRIVESGPVELHPVGTVSNLVVFEADDELMEIRDAIARMEQRMDAMLQTMAMVSQDNSRLVNEAMNRLEAVSSSLTDGITEVRSRLDTAELKRSQIAAQQEQALSRIEGRTNPPNKPVENTPPTPLPPVPSAPIDINPFEEPETEFVARENEQTEPPAVIDVDQQRPAG